MQSSDLAGFRLYQDNHAVCSIASPSARSMDCTFESPYGTYNFYLTSYSAGAESPLSDPFPFTLVQPTPEEPIAEVTVILISLEDSLVLQLTPTSSLDDILYYTWSFNDGSADITNQGETITHTFPANEPVTYTLTITDSSNEEHIIYLTTITFLKNIQGNIMNIMSFLLLEKEE